MLGEQCGKGFRERVQAAQSIFKLCVKLVHKLPTPRPHHYHTPLTTGPAAWAANGSAEQLLWPSRTLSRFHFPCQLHSWERSGFICRYMMAVHVCAAHTHAHIYLLAYITSSCMRALNLSAQTGRSTLHSSCRRPQGSKCLLSFCCMPR